MWKIIIFVFLTLLIALLSIAIIYFYIPKSTLVFKESDKEVTNPGRGFYVQIYSDEEERLEKLKNENVEIVLVAYDIEDFLNIKISKEKLKELEILLDKVRQYDMKIIFRAAYGFDSDYEDPKTIENIYSHIKQIAPILNVYKDVVLCVQAGFLGPWGEWHSSKFLANNDDEIYLRNQLLVVLLESLSQDIIVNVRRPRFIRDAIYAGLDKSRLGLHNDALLSTKDDMGTYDDPSYTREEELIWVKTNINHGINGGEMPLVSEFSSINNAIDEMKNLQLTYLNSRYNKEVLEEWKTKEYMGQNGFEYVKNHLGYRLWLGKIKLSNYIKSNRKFSIKVVIHNSGFAPIDDRYQLFLVFIRGEKIIFESKIEGNLSSIKCNEAREFTMNTYIDDLIRLDSKEDIRVGLYISNSNTTQSYSKNLDNNIGKIELANSDVIYEKGINFFANFKFDNDRYVLEK